MLKNLKENDNGYYVCNGTDKEGRMFHERALLLVGGIVQIISSLWDLLKQVWLEFMNIFLS